MRKAIGLAIIAVSIVLGLYLHDKYMTMLIQEEQALAPKPQYLQFINDQILPNEWPGDPVKVGGLSGLAWSELQQTLYAVSDDRGGRGGPSRYYELKLSSTGDEKFEVQVKAVHQIKRPDKQRYPDRSLDPEGIAVDASGWVYISSEGDFVETPSAVPALLKLNAQGEEQARYNFPMPWFPKNIKDRLETLGVRKNLAFESLDINLSEKVLVTATESALIQDGDVASVEKGAPVRISFNALSDEKLVSEIGQFVYPLSPIPSRILNTESVIGVTDVIAFKNRKLLVLERAYLAGRSKNRIRLFAADCSDATDVKTLKSLNGVEYKSCEKQEIFDFDNLIGSLSDQHPRVDNLEGMTLGPQLEDGSHLLIVISDNNFSPLQKTQVLFFRMRPPDGWEL